MLSVAKLATPLTAAAAFVPASVPPLGLVPPSATVTWPVKLGTVFPEASCADTSTAGARVAPAVALPGCTVNTRWVAGPGLISNGALVAAESPLAVAVVGSTLNASWVGTVGPVGPRSHVARNSEDSRSAAPGSSRAPSVVEGARMVVAIGQCSWTYISFPRLGLRNSHWRWENG